MITIVITTFNRLNIVNQAIDSALAFFPDPKNAEIILVDDCSSDGTVNSIKASYKLWIQAGILKIIELEQNIGVTGAKNAGALIASNKWITFLDSDDKLISNTYYDAISILNQLPSDVGIVFFRCITMSGLGVGRYIDAPIALDINHYILNGTFGESIPFVQKDIFGIFNYPSDLRGFEGFSYFMILLAGYKAYIYPLCVRCYNDDSADSLSNQLKSGYRSRSISIGYFRMLKIGISKLSAFSSFMLFLKMCFHFIRFLMYLIYRFFEGLKTMNS